MNNICVKKHIVILGAGISGLSAAWRLGDNGNKVDILESNRNVGGLSGTLRENGLFLDFGPHSFFSEDKHILDMVLDLFSHKLQPMQRTVKFYYEGKYIDYPLTPHGILLQMGFFFGIRAALSFLKSKIFIRKKILSKNQNETVKDWAIENFGEHLYRVFFKPYTEQFWKMPCSQLSARTIPSHTKTSFANTLRLLIHKKVSKKGDSLIEREMLPTFYPDTGFAEIPERIAEVVKKKNVKIYLGCNAKKIMMLKDKRIKVVYEHNGNMEEIICDHVISTAPVTLLINMLTPKPPSKIIEAANSLNYRSLIVLGMLTEKQDILKCGYIYVLNKPYNRIFEMNNFSAKTSPLNKNILGVEIPCLHDSIAWNASKEELFEMCIGSLAKEGFIGLGDVEKLLLIKIPHAYPIYHKDYEPNLNKVLSYLENYTTLNTLGRSGEFMYMDIDKCMKRAINFIDNNIARF